MLRGSADPLALGADAPRMEGFGTEPLELPGVETLQVLFEIERSGADALLPPGLHPTIPPALSWMVQRVPESPWGPFALAQCRIECRSGLRPRGFLRGGVIDQPEAAAALAARWGFALRAGEVRLERAYDRIRATVALGAWPILGLSLEDPTPLRPEDVFYVASVHLAHTPRGLRLVQVDPEFAVARAERGGPRLHGFDAAAWRAAGARPSHAVSASFSVSDLTLPALRFVCRPEALAFEGTERVDA